ncbi:hypothetical protein PR202_ga02174 [Eleusine coracana subsp. coracana]|uniref:Uncharacterized protein n=1 Tax=Eleusine coracana subsp. coracana TaxID=191504 RepID=A0AAV5BIR7_ELECO|nr:hypothetical protein PR202_ga02174 [Eleusine coracana subsp. coracana]
MTIAAAVSAPTTSPVHVAPRHHASPTVQPRPAPRHHHREREREHSPLNPSTSTPLRSSSPSPPSAATDGARAHIANLDRVLGKPPQVPRTAAASSKQQQQQQQQEEDGENNSQLNVRHGLLNALNLSFFVPMPGMRARTAAHDEHMSPRSLMHMQQLLSADSPRASPRCTIAPRWRALHGEGGWAGLLDPLDSDLRRELLRYGDFVTAAYQAFHSLPTASARHRGLMLPDRSYRPTRSLFATSALSMPPWAKRPNTPDWLTQQSNWVGYVAVCESEREVARMGRRDIAIVLRGTATCLEWAENLRASLVPLDDGDNSDGAAAAPESEPKVARGFLSLYKTEGDKREQYQHAGAELRIDSKNSPCLRPDAGPACRHDLEAYLHLIDGFTGTGRPFRHDARRSVIRLLQLQRGNVKKEYVNRARELGVDPAAPADVARNVAYGSCALASPSS